METTWYWQ